MGSSKLVSFLGICLVMAGCGPAAPVTPPTESPTAHPTPFSPRPELEPITPGNVARLEVIDRWGKGNIYGAAYSPDGSRIAVFTATGVYIYNSLTLQEQGFIDLPMPPRDQGYPTAGLAYSPDGSLIALAGNAWIRFWNLSTYETDYMHTRTPGFEPIQIEFSPDGASLAVMSMGSYLPCDAWGGNFALYRLQDQRLLYSRNFCPQASLFYFRFGTNGKVYFVSNIVDSDPGAEVSVVDAATGQLLDRVPYDFESAVYDVSFDGSRYAVRAFQDGDEFTRIVEAGTNRILETIPGDVVFLPDPDKLLVDRGEGPWEVIEDGSPICGFNDATIPFLLVDAHKSASDLGSEGRFLIQQDAWGGGVQIWDLANCTLSAVIPFPGGDLNPTFSPDGRLLGIDDSSGIGIWDTGTGRFLYVLPRDTVWSSWPSFLFSPDGSCIATYPNEDDLVLWNAEDGRRLRTISLGVHPVDITFGPTCSRLAVTDRAGLSLLDLDSGSPQARQIPIPGEPGSLFWSPDGATIAIETPADAQLAFYDGESGGLLRRIDLGEAAGVAAFSPDWRTFATTADGYLFLWDSTQGIMLRRFSGHHVIGDDSSRTWELSFSANGKMLVSLGSYDDTLRFWDLKSGLLAGELITPFHTRRIALSPDGRLLATSGDDGTIRIWGVRP